MKATFINTISELMDQHDDVVTVTADMGFSVFEELQRKYPKRFINTGVTEQASVSIAAGLALSGYTVYFYAQAAFATMRCFEQLHLDVGYSNLNIKVIGVNAGFSLNQLGVSHFSVEDVGIVRTLPNFTIFTPGNLHEMRWAMLETVKVKGPAYLRYSKLETIHENDTFPSITIGEPISVKKGSNAVMFVSGGIMKQAKEAAKLLKKDNISLALYSMPTVKPLNKKKIITILQKYPIGFTLEEHTVIGGLGSAVAEIVAETSNVPKIKRLGIPDSFTGVTGSKDYLLDINGLSPEKIAATVEKELSVL